MTAAVERIEIPSRFAARCGLCKLRIAVGALCWWRRGERALCAECGRLDAAIELADGDAPAAPPVHEPLIACRLCGAIMTISAGSGPHAARGDCSTCGSWRWIARRELR